MYDHHPGTTGGAGEDAGDVVKARWLQSAGLQHLASPSAASDNRFFPNLLMQGYGSQTLEEKHRLFKLPRNLNFNGESVSEPYTSTAQSMGGASAADGFYSPELRAELGAGLLDLHAMDDTELLSDHVFSEPFEPSPFFPTEGFDDEYDATPTNQQREVDGSIRALDNEKEISMKENNVAKIKVVVRKRPLNKKEKSRKEDDIVTVSDSVRLTVHEPKLKVEDCQFHKISELVTLEIHQLVSHFLLPYKVDLTAYVEKHEFCFDAVLDEHVTNDEVYRVTVEPIIPTIFERAKATCFAYGQTGSGKTYTMQPLPLRAAQHIVQLLHKPFYRDQNFKLWLSFFEIYGGKLFDLLCDRRKLCMREDGKQQVCIVGLQEFEVSNVQMVKEFIEKGNAARSTGSTGANEESSRSHAILQLAIKKHREVEDNRRQKESTELKSGKVVGKISFIDLAGSERGADTTDNDRQTRIEGAEINKSLLALKECIRALDNDQIHIPFRGSKLTEVLRDSFVGNSRTVMISCISPNAGSCEHTLNTLRYADRVKSLSKTGNSRKDQVSAPLVTSSKDAASSLSYKIDKDDLAEQNQVMNAVELPNMSNTENNMLNSSSEFDKNSLGMINYACNGREDIMQTSSSLDRKKLDMKNNLSGYSSRPRYVQDSYDTQDEEKVPRVSPPRRKLPKEERSVRQNDWLKKESGTQLISASHKQQQVFDASSYTTSKQYEPEVSCNEEEINVILEEEDALIAAHRKEIENTVEIVREEMNLLAEVDQPGSFIDNYVTQLNFVLSRKAAGLVSLQARLARFQQRLKEHDILSRKKGPK